MLVCIWKSSLFFILPEKLPCKAISDPSFSTLLRHRSQSLLILGIKTTRGYCVLLQSTTLWVKGTALLTFFYCPLKQIILRCWKHLELTEETLPPHAECFQWAARGCAGFTCALAHLWAVPASSEHEAPLAGLAKANPQNVSANWVMCLNMWKLETSWTFLSNC